MHPAAPRSRVVQALCRPALPSLAAALVLLAGAALPLAAQEEEAPNTVALRGQVVDHSTGQPLQGAVVEIERLSLRAATDAEGHFSFRKVPPGGHDVAVTLLGYDELAQRVDVSGSEAVVRLALRSDPVVLEGLTVKMNLLERRRNQIAVASRAFDHRQLALSSAPSVESFLRTRGGVYPVDCPQRRSFVSDCVYSRGSVQPAAVFLDEMPIFSFAHLNAVHPSEVARIEVFQGGRHVRVYTAWFMEEAARGKRFIQPIIF